MASYFADCSTIAEIKQSYKSPAGIGITQLDTDPPWIRQYPEAVGFAGPRKMVMKMRIRLLLIVAAAWTFIASAPISASTFSIVPAQVPATATKITFETNPAGNPVALNSKANIVWSPLGVTFDGDDYISGPFELITAPNVLSAGTSTTSIIQAKFSPPALVMGAWGFDFVLEVFDAQGNSLGSNTHTDGSAGLYGGPGEYGFLGFLSTVPIATAKFRHAFPNNQAFGFHIDDLVFKLSDPIPVPQFGDFDGDRDVDGADFVAWQTHFPKASGATLAQGDADSDGDVDGNDFVIWQLYFPTSAPAASAPVPEPSALAIGICAAIGVFVLRRRFAA